MFMPLVWILKTKITSWIPVKSVDYLNGRTFDETGITNIACKLIIDQFTFNIFVISLSPLKA